MNEQIPRKILWICIYLFVGILPASAQEKYDVVILDGRVIDGAGNPWHYADIGIRGERIVKIGRLEHFTAPDTVNADGLFVVPGFIDVHTHAGSGLTKAELSDAEPLLRQGITTVVINPDGGGEVDIELQRKDLLNDGIGVNVAQLIPHGSIRREVLGMEDREATKEELEEMARLVKKGMEQGAFGLSSGPFYAPGSYASTEELIQLAQVAADYGGVYTSHIRDESNYTIGLEAAVDEVITVAEQANLPGVVTHIKALGPPVWGYSQTIVRNIEKAREEGIEVYADQYPYTASATGLIAALVPRWAEEGGHEALVNRLNNSGILPKIRSAMIENLARRGGAERIQFRYFEPDSTIEGKTLQQVARERNKDPVDMAISLIKEGRPGIVSFNMSDDDVHRFMKQPWTMTSSDGGLVKMGKGVPHPRSYAAFTEKIRKYVMQDSIITLSAAIRSMTSLSAQVFGIEERGLLRSGMKADIVILDLDEVDSKATYQNPHQLSQGVSHLLINGEFAIRDKKFLDSRKGKILNKLTSSN